MTRVVAFQPAGRVHPAHRAMIEDPPPGYRFVVPSGPWDAGLRALMGSDLAYHRLASRVDRLLPLHLVKSRLDGLFRSHPAGADLTYAVNQIVTRDEPWVAFLECVTAPAGFTAERLRKRRAMVEDTFASASCRRVLTWSELTRRSILESLDCSRFGDRIEVVRFAPKLPPLESAARPGRVRLLFLGTANAPGAFNIRGGREVLEAFSPLSQRYPDVELVVRSDIPPEVRARYRGHPRVLFVEGALTAEELDALYRSAHVFLFPAYYSPWITALEAMSYGLPVITTNVYANPEMVQDGVSGFVVPTSTIPPWSGSFLPPNTAKDPDYERAIREPDLAITSGVVDRVGRLLDDPPLREAMGRAARARVEKGPYSPGERNRALARIFDESLESPAPAQLAGVGA